MQRVGLCSLGHTNLIVWIAGEQANFSSSEVGKKRRKKNISGHFIHKGQAAITALILTSLQGCLLRNFSKNLP
jgi:hypothetical protein